MQDFLGLGNGTDGGVNSGTDRQGLVFDLTGVEEDKGFELLPKGDYPAIVDELEFKESSKGDPMLAVKLKITEGEFEGRVVFDYWVLGGKGAEFGQGKLKKFLTRIVPDADLSAFNPETFADEGTAIGLELVVSLKIQTQTKGEYKGEKRNQVADFKAISTNSFL